MSHSTRCILTGEWVTKFRLLVSSDGNDWQPYCARRGHPTTFTGNTDSSTAIQQRFVVPVTTRFVRVVPLEWHGRPALRVELYTRGWLPVWW